MYVGADGLGSIRGHSHSFYVFHFSDNLAIIKILVCFLSFMSYNAFILQDMLKFVPLLTNDRYCCIRHRSQLGQCKIRSPMSAKKKRLKCAHPGREMLLIYCISPKVTELWESGLCGSFRLPLTQLHCPFISFKNLQHWYSISQTDTVLPKVRNGVGEILFLFFGFKEETLC